jgi:hypothetical protein
MHLHKDSRDREEKQGWKEKVCSQGLSFFEMYAMAQNSGGTNNPKFKPGLLEGIFLKVRE